MTILDICRSADLILSVLEQIEGRTFNKNVSCRDRTYSREIYIRPQGLWRRRDDNYYIFYRILSSQSFFSVAP